MKNIISILLWIFPAVAFSQAKSQKVDITRTIYSPSQESVSVLEVGIDNALSINVNDKTVQRLLVNSSQGKVTQKGNQFIVHPEKPGEIILKIYNYNDLSHPVLIETRKMTVLPAPAAIWGGKNGGEISHEEIRNASVVRVSGLDQMKIRGFRLSVAGKGIKYREFQSKDDQLTPEMVECLQTAPAGAKIFIEYIRAGYETDPSTRQLAPLSFVVTEQ